MVSSYLTRATAVALFGWVELLGEQVGPLGGRMGWRAFARAAISTIFWASLVGLALCQFTNAGAWLTEVVA